MCRVTKLPNFEFQRPAIGPSRAVGVGVKRVGWVPDRQGLVVYVKPYAQRIY